MAPQYKYTPLALEGEIRILEVERPATPFPKAINFNLRRVQLKDNPAYEAVSYTWGCPDRTQLVTEKETGRELGVTENCFIALYDLCEKGPRTLWVDAICINQDDVTEKAKQVAIMGRIFMSASRTVIYLGKADAHSRSVAKLPRMAEGNLIRNDPLSLQLLIPRDILDRKQKKLTREQKNLSRAQKVLHLEQFLERPWFARVWILQEVLLSNPNRIIAQAGKDQIEWEQICFWGHKRPGLFTLLNWYEEDLGSLAGPVFEWSKLFEVLRQTTNQVCGDPRDKLFALMALFKDETPPGLSIDYSLSVAELYTQLSVYLLEQVNYKVLTAARGIVGDPEVPTWVIDLRNFRNGFLDVESASWGYRSTKPLGNERGCEPNDGPHTRQYFSRLPDNRSIMVRGVRLGTVTQIGLGIFRLGFEPPEWESNLVREGQGGSDRFWKCIPRLGQDGLSNR